MMDIIQINHCSHRPLHIHPYKTPHLSLQTPIRYLLPSNPARLNTPYTAAAIQSPMEAAGLDSDGREFKNSDEMWREQTGDDNKKTQWYRDGVSYWEVSFFLDPIDKYEVGICC